MPFSIVWLRGNHGASLLLHAAYGRVKLDAKFRREGCCWGWRVRVWRQAKRSCQQAILGIERLHPIARRQIQVGLRVVRLNTDCFLKLLGGPVVVDGVHGADRALQSLLVGS